MTVEEITASVRMILSMFVPGFVFLSIINFYNMKKTKSDDISKICCVVISYIFYIVLGELDNITGKKFFSTDVMSIVTAMICAIVYVKISQSKRYEKLLIYLGRTSNKNNIWEVLFDPLRGAEVRIKTEIHNEPVEIEGTVESFSVRESGDCDIALKEYSIEYLEQGITYVSSSGIDKMDISEDVREEKIKRLLLYVNSERITSLESALGSGKKSPQK